MRTFLVLSACFLIISACGTVHEELPEAGPTLSVPSPSTEVSSPTLLKPASTITETETLTATLRAQPGGWQDWPVIPDGLSERMMVVYRQGLELGNNPHAFSKVGDGGISTIWFLHHYDLGSEYYDLGEYPDLQRVIDQFQGSFSRVSLAAGRGFDTTIILDPKRADQDQCLAGETSLECEVRLHQPAFAILSLGTNQIWVPEIYEPGLGEIIECLLERGVVPILSTKADNKEGDQRINLIIARMAYEYELPLWNFWRVVQPLPAHGLQEDLEHLTYAESDFSNPYAMLSAWPWRNLTALQTLQALWQFVEK